MKTFKDWAGQEIIYSIVYEEINEDTDEKTYRCYIKPNGIDDEWFPIGSGRNKDAALEDAINEWNYFDTVGRG